MELLVFKRQYFWARTIRQQTRISKSRDSRLGSSSVEILHFWRRDSINRVYYCGCCSLRPSHQLVLLHCSIPYTSPSLGMKTFCTCFYKYPKDYHSSLSWIIQNMLPQENEKELCPDSAPLLNLMHSNALPLIPSNLRSVVILGFWRVAVGSFTLQYVNG